MLERETSERVRSQRMPSATDDNLQTDQQHMTSLGVHVCMYIFIHQTWIYTNYTLIMKIIIYSVKISSPIGTISNSEVVDSAIIVKLGKYKIICKHGRTYGCRLCSIMIYSQ